MLNQVTDFIEMAALVSTVPILLKDYPSSVEKYTLNILWLFRIALQSLYWLFSKSRVNIKLNAFV
jgi:hypothetical protein